MIIFFFLLNLSKLVYTYEAYQHNALPSQDNEVSFRNKEKYKLTINITTLPDIQA